MEEALADTDNEYFDHIDSEDFHLPIPPEIIQLQRHFRTRRHCSLRCYSKPEITVETHLDRLDDYKHTGQ